jgi:hypothetical protein
MWRAISFEQDLNGGPANPPQNRVQPDVYAEGFATARGGTKSTQFKSTFASAGFLRS